MPIHLPNGLPAAAELAAEGVALLPDGAGSQAAARPLNIALVNLMPDKPTTERQFARMLGGQPLPVRLILAIPDGHRPRTTAPGHMDAFYRRWPEMAGQELDGLIITGAPVEEIPFDAVDYWPSLAAILDEIRARRLPSLLVCWAAQAALHRWHRVPRHRLEAKAFGVFPHRVADASSPLLAGIGGRFHCPVSRWTEVRAPDLPPASSLRVLATSDVSGLCLVEDASARAALMFNHLEYEPGTLASEYRRDLARGRTVAPPHAALPGDEPEAAQPPPWRRSARIFFRNWLEGVAKARRMRAGQDALIAWTLSRAAPLTGGGSARRTELPGPGSALGRILPLPARCGPGRTRPGRVPLPGLDAVPAEGKDAVLPGQSR